MLRSDVWLNNRKTNMPLICSLYMSCTSFATSVAFSLHVMTSRIVGVHYIFQAQTPQPGPLSLIENNWDHSNYNYVFCGMQILTHAPTPTAVWINQLHSDKWKCSLAKTIMLVYETSTNMLILNTQIYFICMITIPDELGFVHLIVILNIFSGCCIFSGQYIEPNTPKLKCHSIINDDNWPCSWSWTSKMHTDCPVRKPSVIYVMVNCTVKNSLEWLISKSSTRGFVITKWYLATQVCVFASHPLSISSYGWPFANSNSSRVDLFEEI